MPALNEDKTMTLRAGDLGKSDQGRAGVNGVSLRAYPENVILSGAKNAVAGGAP